MGYTHRYDAFSGVFLICFCIELFFATPITIITIAQHLNLTYEVILRCTRTTETCKKYKSCSAVWCPLLVYSFLECLHYYIIMFTYLDAFQNYSIYLTLWQHLTSNHYVKPASLHLADMGCDRILSKSTLYKHG